MRQDDVAHTAGLSALKLKSLSAICCFTKQAHCDVSHGTAVCGSDKTALSVPPQVLRKNNGPRQFVYYSSSAAQQTAARRNSLHQDHWQQLKGSQQSDMPHFATAAPRIEANSALFEVKAVGGCVQLSEQQQQAEQLPQLHQSEKPLRQQQQHKADDELTKHHFAAPPPAAPLPPLPWAQKPVKQANQEIAKEAAEQQQKQTDMSLPPQRFVVLPSASPVSPLACIQLLTEQSNAQSDEGSQQQLPVQLQQQPKSSQQWLPQFASPPQPPPLPPLPRRSLHMPTAQLVAQLDSRQMQQHQLQQQCAGQRGSNQEGPTLSCGKTPAVPVPCAVSPARSSALQASTKKEAAVPVSDMHRLVAQQAAAAASAAALRRQHQSQHQHKLESSKMPQQITAAGVQTCAAFDHQVLLHSDHITADALSHFIV